MDLAPGPERGFHPCLGWGLPPYTGIMDGWGARPGASLYQWCVVA